MSVRDLLIVVLLALLMPVSGFAGELHRWKDAVGHLHFTDTPPPPGAEPVVMESRAISVVETVPAPKRARNAPVSAVVQRELDWQHGVRSPAERSRQRAEAAADAQCARLKKQLQKMDRDPKISVRSTFRYEEAYEDAGCR